ncbi:MAG: S-layer homology domain-containing protein [bacterium]|nr:S-layer homology domain-containing protein [bacterium]MDE0439836.1 S-layer homology domain-containing protein [bacterium]
MTGSRRTNRADARLRSGLVVLVVGLLLPVVLGSAPVVAQNTDHSAEPGNLCDDVAGVEQFADVENSDYGAAYVLCMRTLGLSAGRDDGTYGPAAELTRGQMASFVVRLWRDALGNECPSGVVLPFRDTVGNTHAASIECLFGLGITKGLTATTYGPGADLKASQISRFLFRMHRKATEAMNVGTGACSDSGSRDELEGAVACLAGLRVVPTDAEAASSDAVTRAQMAVYMIGLWHNLAGRGLPPLPPQRPAPAETRPAATTRQIAYARGEQDAWDPAWSPDGTRITYTRYRGIGVMSADGTNRQQLTKDHGWNPQWSPDSTRIVYNINSRVTDSDGGVWVMNTDGTNQRQLTNDDGWNPQWSPDGTQITYTGYDGIAIVNADGTNQRQLTNDRGWGPQWSPDGTQITYSAGGVWVMNADGTNQRQLTNDDGQYPQWSPDGTQIAYNIDILPFYRPTNSDHGIWVMNADGTRRQQLTTYGEFPQWSPDSTRITYSYFVGGLTHPERGVWVMNADGTNQRQLTNDGGWGPQWSPDGTQITYTGYDGIPIVNTDGTNQRILTNDGIWVIAADGPDGDHRQLTIYGWDPQWSPDSARIAYSIDGGISVMDADGTNQTRITNRGWDPQWSPDSTRIVYNTDSLPTNLEHGVWVNRPGFAGECFI